MNKRSVIVGTSKDTDSTAVLETDARFFNALIHSDIETLERILSDDFIIIDVMRGAETTKPETIGAIETGYVRFEKIEIQDNRVRLYGRSAVITGQTQMTLSSGGMSLSISSRYTHVYGEFGGQWRLVSAQGTSIQASL